MDEWAQLASCPSNTTFLDRVFPHAKGAIWLVAFEGDPAQVPFGVWRGAPFHHGEELYLEFARKEAVRFNTFFCISTFAEREGRLARRIENFSKNYCAVLDDIGTGLGAKVSPDKVMLDPSWVIETSPANYQVGYCWQQPNKQDLRPSALG